MSIDRQTDIEATLQIGPTTAGMVRVYVEGDGVDLPMDFSPEEAEEIAQELLSAAANVRQAGSGGEAKAGRRRHGQGRHGDDRPGRSPSRGRR